MEVSIIRSREELAGLEQPWKELMDALERPEIFDAWEWLQSYLTHLFSRKDELFIIVVTDRDKCVAIAPLCIAKQKIKWMNVKTLKFIVSGTGETNSFYIHQNVNYVKALKEIAKVLKEHSNEWDWIDLFPVHSLHPMTGLIRHVFEDVYDVYAKTGSLSPYLIPERFHRDKLALSRIKAIDRKERKLRREQETKLVIHAPVEERVWNSFTEMHKQRWAPNSLFNESGMLTFYRDVLNKFQDTDGAYFSYIEINGSIASAMLTLTYKSKVYLYITSFSNRYNEYGVGLVLLNRVMEHYLESGVSEIDFMSGSQEYKFFWSDTARVNTHIRLISRDSGRKLLKAYTLLQMNKDGIRSLLAKRGSAG